MRLFPRNLMKACLGMLALLLVGTLPAAAAGIAIKNDLPVPVVIQGTSIVNGMIRRSPPLLIPPGKTAIDVNVPPGIRSISIFEAKQPPRRMVPDVAVPVQNRDLFFSLQPLPGGRVALKEEPPPTPPKK